MQRFHKFTSDFVCGTIGGGVVKFGFSFSNVHLYNREVLQEHAFRRPVGQPLITVCNHVSTIDDPVVWGLLLDWKYLWKSEMLRWSLGAKEILFTNPFYRYFFGHCGKSIAIERGAGLYQEGMQQSIDILNKGGWVHVFPEGKVHKDGTLHKLRWGIGKLVESAHPTPYVLPFYHLGSW